MNGIVKGDKTSIAAWYGGPMVDRDTFTAEELETKVPGTDYAMSLLRHDGTGYLAGGNIHWDADGVLSGNFNSFILQGTSLVTMFYYIRLFYLHYGNPDTTDFNNIDYVTPMKPFSRLSVLPLGGIESGHNLPTGLFIGDSNTGGSFQIGNIIIRTKSGDPNILEIVSASSNKTAHLGVQGGVSAYGTYTPSTGGGGGLNGTIVPYATAIASDPQNEGTKIASASSIYKLHSRISSIENNGATSITVTGTGNAITSVSKNGTSITFTKGATFLTSHQSLANYYIKSQVDNIANGKSSTSHTHSVTINGVTKTIAASGGTAVNLGTYLTTHQSLADYAKKSEIPIKVSQLTNDKNFVTGSVSGQTITINGVSTTWRNTWRGITDSYSDTSTDSSLSQKGANSLYNALYNGYASSAGNADTVDSYHANGLLTALSNSNNGISITVGGTTKSVSNINVNYASSAGNADTVDNEHASAFTRIVGRHSINTTGTAPYNYIHLFRIANSSVYSTLDCEIDIRTRYHSAKIEIRIAAEKYPYNAGGTSISIVKNVISGRTCNLWVLPTVQSSNYNYYDVYYESGAWNNGSYGITLKGLNGNLIFEHKGTKLTNLPDKVSPVTDNVATSATKLQTPRTIWGQSFDGTGNVSGSLSGVGHIQFSTDNSYNIGTTTSEAANTYTRQIWAKYLNASRVYTADTNLYIGYNNTAQIKFYSGSKQSGDGSNERMTILTTGNIGIGTNSPAYKLHVAGNIYASDTIIGESNKIGLTIRGRLDSLWSSWFAHETSGNEALVIATQNEATAIMLTNGESYNNISDNRYASMTPALTIEHNQVMINRPYSSSGCGYNFYVNGTSNFNGEVKVNNMLIGRGIMFTTADSNVYGTSLQNWDGSIGANVTNMFNGIVSNNISLEYSTNGGSSWLTYTTNTNYLFNLINDNSGTENFYLGNNVVNGSSDADKLTQIKKNQLRVTIKIPPEVYQELAWISVDVSNGVDIKCQVYFGNSNGVYTEYVSKVFRGWSHRCDICVGPLNVNVGNDTYRYVRLVFSHLSNHTSLCNGIVSKIRALALTKYNNPSERYNISTTGHIYDYDYNMNTYFPNSILAKGGVTAYQSSDIRLKTNITKLNCLKVIKSIGGTYEFDYIRDHKHSIGFIAQNVNNPLLKDIVAKDDNDYLKINYWNPKLISLAFGALTEIDDEVDKLKARVRELESEVEYLKNKDYALQ